MSHGQYETFMSAGFSLWLILCWGRILPLTDTQAETAHSNSTVRRTQPTRGTRV